MSVNKSKEQFKKGFYKLRLILDSATFALLLSVFFFLYEMNRSAREKEEVVEELIGIKNNLTTRYLGLFPEYIDNINSLLKESVEHSNNSEERDSIIWIKIMMTLYIPISVICIRKCRILYQISSHRMRI